MPSSGYLTSRPLKIWNQYSPCILRRRVDRSPASAHDAGVMSERNPFVLSLSKDASNISEH